MISNCDCLQRKSSDFSLSTPLNTMFHCLVISMYLFFYLKTVFLKFRVMAGGGEGGEVREKREGLLPAHGWQVACSMLIARA